MAGRRARAVLAFCAALILAPRLGWAEEAAADAEEPGAEVEAAVGEDEAAPADEAAEAPVGDEESDPGQYSVRLRDLETRINLLQEQIFRSKARLSLLAESVLQGVIAGSKAVVVHRNEMGSSFRLVRAVYALDGAPIFSRTDESGELGRQEEIELFNGSIVPGEHTLSVSLEYQGHGYGIFSYLKGYRFKVRSSHTFTATEGKLLQVRVTAYEKGGPTTPLEERPDIRYVERVDSLSAATAVTDDEGEEEQ